MRQIKRKPKTDFYLTHGNHKLSSKIIIFTLPSGITCPGKGECAKWCYSQKAEKLYPQVIAARKRNFEASKQPDFKSKMIEALQWEMKHGRNILRLHQDGDIWCSSYWELWKDIAKRLPKLTIFCYTKSHHLPNLWTNLPKNIILIQSYGSKFDQLIDYRKSTARVIDKVIEAKKGEYVCPYFQKTKGFKCGESCTYCMQRTGIKHVCFLRH